VAHLASSVTVPTLAVAAGAASPSVPATAQNLAARFLTDAPSPWTARGTIEISLAPVILGVGERLFT
jgi:hypothetical protein